MRLFFAIFIPPVAFFMIDKPSSGFIALLLMLTIYGWPMGSLWAVYAVGQYESDLKIDALRKQIAALDR